MKTEKDRDRQVHCFQFSLCMYQKWEKHCLSECLKSLDTSLRRQTVETKTLKDKSNSHNNKKKGEFWKQTKIRKPQEQVHGRVLGSHTTSKAPQHKASVFFKHFHVCQQANIKYKIYFPEFFLIPMPNTRWCLYSYSKFLLWLQNGWKSDTPPVRFGQQTVLKFASPQEYIEKSLSFYQHRNFTLPATIIHQRLPSDGHVHIQFHAVTLL